MHCLTNRVPFKGIDEVLQMADWSPDNRLRKIAGCKASELRELCTGLPPAVAAMATIHLLHYELDRGLPRINDVVLQVLERIDKKG